MKKRIAFILIAFLMMFSLFACNNPIIDNDGSGQNSLDNKIIIL